MEEKTDYNMAPQKGYVLAYFREGVAFGKYIIENGNVSAECLKPYENGKLLELHLFDPKKEFRVVVKSDGSILKEIVSCSDEQDEQGKDDPNLFYEENMLIYGDELQKEALLKVRSHIQYDENDMIMIPNYRLVGIYTQEKELI